MPANELSGCLKDLGFDLRRYKTGTPARVDGLMPAPQPHPHSRTPPPLR